MNVAIAADDLDRRCVLATFAVDDAVCVVVPAAGAALQSGHVGTLTLGSSTYEICLTKAEAPAAPPDSDALSTLTSRELEVAMLISMGHSNKQIARRLGISRYTVGTHIARLFVKLGVHNRPALVTRVLARLPAL
jgi:DNA-binding NarL/FixJ family response regulator